jgi:uncharacterized membrane protein YGL010W
MYSVAASTFSPNSFLYSPTIHVFSILLVRKAPDCDVINRVFPLSKSQIVPPAAKLMNLVLPVVFGVYAAQAAALTNAVILVVEDQSAAWIRWNVYVLVPEPTSRSPR